MSTTKEKRNIPSKRIALTDEDFSILWGLSLKSYRFLACRHIAILYRMTETDCEKRMSQLCRAGLVKKLHLPLIVERHEDEPIYTLDRLGAYILARRYHVEARRLYSPLGERSYLFLAHAVAIVDVRVALSVALRGKENARLLFWRSEKDLRIKRTAVRKRNSSAIPVLPDGAFGIGVERRQFFYTLEMDRGTTSIKTEREKMKGYIALYRRGSFREFLDVPHFRVLLVTPHEKRLSGMLSALRDLGHCQKMFMFTTKDKITPETMLNRVWVRASDDELRSILE